MKNQSHHSEIMNRNTNSNYTTLSTTPSGMTILYERDERKYKNSAYYYIMGKRGKLKNITVFSSEG